MVEIRLLVKKKSAFVYSLFYACVNLHITCTVRTNDITNVLTKPNVNLQCLFAIIADF